MSVVVVLCKNQFYYFSALWPDSGHVAVDEADILDILDAIQRHADKADLADRSKAAIGVFTSLPRSKWAVRFVMLGSYSGTMFMCFDGAAFVKRTLTTNASLFYRLHEVSFVKWNRTKLHCAL